DLPNMRPNCSFVPHRRQGTPYASHRRPKRRSTLRPPSSAMITRWTCPVLSARVTAKSPDATFPAAWANPRIASTFTVLRRVTGSIRLFAASCGLGRREGSHPLPQRGYHIVGDAHLQGPFQRLRPQRPLEAVFVGADVYPPPRALSPAVVQLHFSRGRADAPHQLPLGADGAAARTRPLGRHSPFAPSLRHGAAPLQVVGEVGQSRQVFEDSLALALAFPVSLLVRPFSSAPAHTRHPAGQPGIDARDLVIHAFFEQRRQRLVVVVQEALFQQRHHLRLLRGPAHAGAGRRRRRGRFQSVVIVVGQQQLFQQGAVIFVGPFVAFVRVQFAFVVGELIVGPRFIILERIVGVLVA